MLNNFENKKGIIIILMYESVIGQEINQINDWGGGGGARLE